MSGSKRPDNEGWETTSVANLVKHLDMQIRFPRTLALNKPIVKSWIMALDTGMRRKALKVKTRLVLQAFRERDGITEEDADRYQANHPPRTAKPVLTTPWVRYRIRPGNTNPAGPSAAAPQRAAIDAAAAQPSVVPRAAAAQPSAAPHAALRPPPPSLPAVSAPADDPPSPSHAESSGPAGPTPVSPSLRSYPPLTSPTLAPLISSSPSLRSFSPLPTPPRPGQKRRSLLQRSNQPKKLKVGPKPRPNVTYSKKKTTTVVQEVSVDEDSDDDDSDDDDSDYDDSDVDDESVDNDDSSEY